MEIRKAEKEEALEISKIQAAGWRTTYNTIIPADELSKIKDDNWEEMLTSVIKNDNPYLYVVEEDGQVIANILFGKSRDMEDCGEIYALYVLKEHQKKGVGRLLLEKAFEILNEKYSKIILKVLRDNHNAREFYQKMGFIYIEDLEIELFSLKLLSSKYEYKKQDF